MPLNNTTLSVLLIEDDDMLLDSISEFINIKDLQLYTATNSIEGTEIVSSGIKPDLLIVDVLLPQANVIEVIDKIRELGCEEVPAIILADDIYENVNNTFDLNKCIVLHKPQEINKLHDYIDELTMSA